MAIKSKTKIESLLKGKTNPELVQTIILAKKNKPWNEVASLLVKAGRKSKFANLAEIEACGSDSVVVCGKVLSEGVITKKVKVIAINFSENAKKKLKEANCEIIKIKDEIKNNKEAKGVVILKK